MRVHNKMQRTVLAGMAALALLGGVSSALGMATFADPTIGTPGPWDPMFVINSGTITGGYADTGLTLELDQFAGAYAGTYTDVIFEFDPLSYAGTFTNGLVGVGEFRFYLRDVNLPGQKGAEIFRINFNEAYLSRSSVGSDNIFTDAGVVFSVAGTPLALDDESVAFSFSHQLFIPAKVNATGFSATAAMTASATPEPATLSVLLLGLPLLGLRRR